MQLDPPLETHVPEGHTIHRMARDHASWFKGDAVRVTSPQGRFPGASEIDGQVLRATEAYGKHLFHRYEDGRSVHVHLGLFGKFQHAPLTEEDHTPPVARDTIRMRVQSGTHWLDLFGATACELLIPDEVDAVIARLGPDPLRKDADPELGWQALQRRSIGIGRSLMDQAVLAGVGNVYRAEVLFVHGIHPEVPSKQISREQWDSMWSTLTEWLKLGVRMNRIVTVDPEEVGRPRSRIVREDATYAYKQDHCRRCGTEIRRWDLAGRWAYACETCQPRPRP